MFSFGLCRAKNFKLVHVIGGEATSISHEISPYRCLGQCFSHAEPRQRHMRETCRCYGVIDEACRRGEWFPGGNRNLTASSSSSSPSFTLLHALKKFSASLSFRARTCRHVSGPLRQQKKCPNVVVLVSIGPWCVDSRLETVQAQCAFDVLNRQRLVSMQPVPFRADTWSMIPRFRVLSRPRMLLSDSAQYY